MNGNESVQPTIISQPTHEQIAVRAYYIWEKAGKPQAREQECWVLAEAELRAEFQKLPEAVCEVLTIPQPKKESLQMTSPLKSPLKKMNTKKRSLGT